MKRPLTATHENSPGCRLMPLVAILLAGVIFVYPLTLRIPLLDPAEGRLAVVALEMVESGDWVTPRLGGELFFDKPILFTWARAISLRWFGTSEAAIRLPGLMFGLLGAVATGAMACRMFGRETGLLAAMFYTTLLLPAALAQAAMGDVALVVWVTLALLLFWESDRANSRRVRFGCTLGIGLLLGLSMLTKGLVGIALVGGVYGCYLLLARHLTVAACIRGAAALAIAAAVATPWYVAVEIRNPGYLHYYFVERHLMGFATGTQVHGGEPWWYYLPVLLGGGLPWIGYLPVTLRDGWSRWLRDARRTQTASAAAGTWRRRWQVVASLLCVFGSDASYGPIVLLWSWLIGGTLLFSVASSKLATYLWPVFPAVAILAAVAWVRLLAGTLSNAAGRTLARTFCTACLLGPLTLPVALAVVQHKFEIGFSWQVWAAGAGASALSWLPLGLWLAGWRRGAISCGPVVVAAQFVVAMTAMLPMAAETTSDRALAEYFNRLREVPSQLLIVGNPSVSSREAAAAEECAMGHVTLTNGKKLPIWRGTVGANNGSLLFYLDRDLRARIKAGQMISARLTDVAYARPDALVAVNPHEVKSAEGPADLARIPHRRVGRYKVYRAADLQSFMLAATVRR